MQDTAETKKILIVTEPGVDEDVKACADGADEGGSLKQLGGQSTWQLYEKVASSQESTNTELVLLIFQGSKVQDLVLTDVVAPMEPLVKYGSIRKLTKIEYDVALFKGFLKAFKLLNFITISFHATSQRLT